MAHKKNPKEVQAVEPEVVEKAEAEASVSLLEEKLPTRIIALPMNQRPVFPSMMLPLLIPNGPLADAVLHAIEQNNGHIGFFLTHSQLEDGHELAYKDLYAVGALGHVSKHVKVEAGVQVFAQVLARFEIEGVVSEDEFITVHGHVVKPVIDPDDKDVRSLAMAIVTALKDLVQHDPVFADEIKMVLANYNNIDGPGRLADLAASLTTAKREEIQEILETFPLIERMEKVLLLLAKENELSQMKSRITTQMEAKVSDHQRKFFLNEQLKAIKEELGIESDGKSIELNKFREKYEARSEGMSEEVREVTEEELNKLGLLDPSSSEYGVSRNRLEWLTDMPWGVFTEDQLDLDDMQKGLDADHYGMDDIKKRIIEFCAVRRLKEDRGGGIITMVGPPGTGKTSIGQSLAKNMGREFFRFSLGGMRDEAEIKGHRRTYVGALPGKIAQALRRCGSMNPVILLDEIDKLSQGMQGDPASALLEVLDPEQNSAFLDHYLDVRVDLSQVLFICTANDLGGIPEPLRDRTEILRLPGYIESEKVAISSSYLVGKQRKKHGLQTKDISFRKTALRALVRGYAREAGVRRLEQCIAQVCRKVATEKARHDLSYASKKKRSKKTLFEKVVITPESLEVYLGKPYMTDEELIGQPTPGVVTGLAWTSMGGATLEIEAVAVPNEKGGFQLSGQLGDVMQESARLARTWLMAHADRLGTTRQWFEQNMVHIHVPAGATPKDGPSAGAAMASAMLSLATGTAIKRGVGMTGELTLTGRVYPIGGVREKTVAAKRAGLKTLLFPLANERDVAELPEHLTTGLRIHYVSQVDEVFALIGL